MSNLFLNMLFVLFVCLFGPTTIEKKKLDGVPRTQTSHV